MSFIQAKPLSFGSFLFNLLKRALRATASHRASGLQPSAMAMVGAAAQKLHCLPASSGTQRARRVYTAIFGREAQGAVL
eukprot:CAMPEP_0183406850 /NCGR_PEP_ID=MMETSP0370-20130417/16919_1 /TAXON_ID=268820 /ORGANISM="Peridinium aciculiferum, Strain PAER-2" /LENGTH=78 /DNA_ID=CAMNT_0025589113 /DNA_START=365 /DNA_END=598 /DNA_ORIENTATION=+